MKIIHDQWGVVEGVVYRDDFKEGTWVLEHKDRRTFFYADRGWRQVPEVVDEDVTGQVEIRDGHMGKCLYFNKDQVGGFCFPIEPRKTEMYDPPENWKEMCRKYSAVFGQSQIYLFGEFLNQFRKPVLTVWRRGEK